MFHSRIITFILLLLPKLSMTLSIQLPAIYYKLFSCNWAFLLRGNPKDIDHITTVCNIIYDTKIRKININNWKYLCITLYIIFFVESLHVQYMGLLQIQTNRRPTKTLVIYQFSDIKMHSKRNTIKYSTNLIEEYCLQSRVQDWSRQKI